MKTTITLLFIILLGGNIMSQIKSNTYEQVAVNTTNSKFAKLKPIPITAVTMYEGFWNKRIQANTDNSILKLLELLESHGVVDNFRRMYKSPDIKRKGYRFTDSDIFKWMEAASYAVIYDKSGKIKKALDKIIDDIAPAQKEDGYLNTYCVDERTKDRFTKLETDHELYCAGHLIQAAVANKRITGDVKLFNIAKKYADYICASFGTDKINNTDGHPEIEMAMIELYRETGDQKYLDIAHFFLNVKNYKNFHEITGHAVRAGYFNCGITDYYLETGENEAITSVEDQWADMIDGKIYITGGVGSRGKTEGFGRKYELPNESAYAETCAGLASIFWNWRLLTARPDAKFSDLIERTLYNLFLSSVSFDGTKYFYENPLYCSNKKESDPWYNWAVSEPPKRVEWYDCTCCPPNIERTFASLPGYFYSLSNEGLWIHLYDNNKLNWKLLDNSNIEIEQVTQYPWSGKIDIKVNSDSKNDFSIFVRIPDWTPKAKISLNNKLIDETNQTGRYFEIKRKWIKSDIITLEFDMPVRAAESDVRLADTRNCVALQRGPIVYCIEEKDNPGFEFNSIRAEIGKDGNLVNPKINYKDNLLDGVTIIEFSGFYPKDVKSQSPLYRFEPKKEIDFNKINLTAIPYYAWNNRGTGQMTIWMLKK